MPIIPQDKPAVQGNDVTVFAKNRCSRPACSEQRRWAAAGEIKKRGAWQLPVFSFSVCRRSCRRHRRRRAPQKRCVNGCQNSRPGGVILSPFPCSSYYNFAFTPLLRSAQEKSLLAQGAICESLICKSDLQIIDLRIIDLQIRSANHRSANQCRALLLTARRISVSATTRPLTAPSRSVLRLRRLMLCGRMSRSAMLLSYVLSRRSIMRRRRR
jgi:hypothetical protein